jgi:hypothetical protein
MYFEIGSGLTPPPNMYKSQLTLTPIMHRGDYNKRVQPPTVFKLHAAPRLILMTIFYYIDNFIYILLFDWVFMAANLGHTYIIYEIHK